MKKALETIEEDGKTYWLEEVKKDGKIVGTSATEIPANENLEGALELFGSKQIYDLAMSQIRTNNRNTVRSVGATIKASSIVDAVVSGKLDASEIQSNAKIWGVDFTKAGIKMLTPEIDGSMITFFTPSKIDEPIKDDPEPNLINGPLLAE